MKKYEILRDRKNAAKVLADLYYDEEKNEFRIVIPRDADTCKLPFALQLCADKGIYELPPSVSMRWVRDRIVPNDRQNIGQFLKSYGLKTYREDLMLEVNEGRTIQDDYKVRRVR